MTAELGQAIEISDSTYARYHGKPPPTLRAVVTEVVDPAVARAQWDAPTSGFRLIAVRFELENLGPGAYSGSPAWNSVVVADTGEEFEWRQHDLITPTINGELRIAVGQKRAGYVPYEIRDGARVIAVQFRPGVLDTAEWTIAAATQEA